MTVRQRCVLRAPLRFILLPLLLLCGRLSPLRADAVDTIVCPLPGDPLAAVSQSAVLTTRCPPACAKAALCVFFPAQTASACNPLALRTPCLAGTGAGAGCAFQCLPADDPADVWYLSFVTSDVPADQVSKWGWAEPNIVINASEVTAFVGDVAQDTPRVIGNVFLVGNERAAAAKMDTYLRDKNYTPRGKIVPFEFPSTFFPSLVRTNNIRLENLRYPTPPPSVNTSSLVFPELLQLYLRNVLLTSMPLPTASFPILEYLDLSANFIRNVTAWAIPDELIFYNLSTNEINFVAKDALPRQLTWLDLSRNPLERIPNGTLPDSIKILYLDDARLSEVPMDIARMDKLSQLYLHNNKLESVPADSLPAASLTALGLRNCSLRDFPSSLRSLAKLTTLSIATNDFSQSPNFSNLPATLESLVLRSCQLQGLPSGMRRLTKLKTLSLEDNPNGVSSLTTLPGALQSLTLDGNALDAIPQGLDKLGQLETLSLLRNALTQMTPGSLPLSLSDVSFSELALKAIPEGILPRSLRRLSVTDSALEEMPRDVGSMQNLVSLNITGCQLRSFDFAETLGLEQLNLGNNRLAKFAAVAPTLVLLNLTNNALAEFNLSQAPLLETLVLANNSLTTVPESLSNFPKLARLDLSANPIRNFTPSLRQIDFFSKVPVVVFDEAMFATNCVATESIDLQGYRVCDPRRVQEDDATSKAPVIFGAIGAAGLAVLVAGFWYRRKLSSGKLEGQYGSGEGHWRNAFGPSIWADPLLLHHRLDEHLVEPTVMLGNGMFGEVWLATYCDKQVAVKKLKQADRASIQVFIEEIKLVLTLSHPRIVSGIGVLWTKETDLALVTEFMAGGDLRSFLDATNPKWDPQMVQIALELTEAIVYLHSLDPLIIHRDLKSRNVLLDAEAHAKLSDFGVSRSKLADMTMTAGVGTVRWIAPEVLAGQRYDESADVYSLGVILSEIDTHKLPFAQATDESGMPLGESAIAGLLISGSLTCQWTAPCPSEIRSLGTQCTSFDPRDRPTSVQVAFQLRCVLESMGGLHKQV